MEVSGELNAQTTPKKLLDVRLLRRQNQNTNSQVAQPITQSLYQYASWLPYKKKHTS